MTGRTARAFETGRIRRVLLACLLLAGICGGAHAGPVALRDDWGRTIELVEVPRRIVSLSPHATELLFTAGAGTALIAVDSHSDHPPQALRLARLSAHPAPDPERLIALRPDLVVVWGAGIGRQWLARFEALGLRVFVSEPRSLEAIATTIEAFSRLAVDPEPGLQRAREFRARRDALRQRYAGRAPVRVFIQAWARPLTTLSDRDTIGDAVRLCSAVNLFGGAPLAAPQVGVETVLAGHPGLIVAIDERADRSQWDAVGVLKPRGPVAFAAVQLTIQRPTARILDPVSELCEAVDKAR